MIAHLRKIRISPKKMNLVAGLVRQKRVKDALAILKFTPKKAAQILGKVVQSAGANAQNNFKQDMETLIVKEIIVNDGPTYKRFQPVSRGRSHPILKRTSHITVKVEAGATLIEKRSAKPKKEVKTKKPKAE
ncbi:MAG: 50S ribosomal protein L22 [uncultured bacterium]|nr:MAG: 50S ribosomal protein L22 [uncultured bacterium]KKT75097.1 MAG: 50S ribosomal protein L22 [Candidatus Peregrinibacteria bacterium GW2011_GWA2_44_7]